MHSSKNFQMPVFLKKLCNILQNEDVSIIGWTADGLAFQVRDTKSLEEKLPTYFRHGKFTSFQRQLNYFGFIKSTLFGHTYHQPNFQRDQPELMQFIQRKWKKMTLAQRELKLDVLNYEPIVLFSTSMTTARTLEELLMEEEKNYKPLLHQLFPFL